MRGAATRGPAGGLPVGPWTPYTPILSGTSSDPTLSNDASHVATGRWMRIGTMVTVWAEIRFGTAGVAAGSGTYSLSLPVPPVTPEDLSVDAIPLGAGYLVDYSDSLRVKVAPAALVAVLNGGVDGEVVIVLDAGQFGAGTGYVTDAVPWTWAAGDSLTFQGDYEAA